MGALPGGLAVITGAASGIGRALAHDLARRGNPVALSDVDGAGLDETARRCKDQGVDVRTDLLDVSDRDAMLAYAVEIQRDDVPVNFVFNNAGVALTADATELRFDDIDWLLGTNLHGVINGSQAFLPALIASGDGHLVNMSSIFGIIGMPTQSIYNASKFGVRGYTEAIAMEMAIADLPVQVHAVHPGGIRTHIADNARTAPSRDHRQLADLFHKRLAQTSPAKAAAIILRGVARGRRRILVGADAVALHLLQQTLGSRYQGLVAAAARRILPAPAVTTPTVATTSEDPA